MKTNVETKKPKPQPRDDFNRRWVAAKQNRRNEALKSRRVMRPNL
jgi:hypothetical protein